MTSLSKASAAAKLILQFVMTAAVLKPIAVANVLKILTDYKVMGMGSKVLSECFVNLVQFSVTSSAKT